MPSILSTAHLLFQALLYYEHVQSTIKTQRPLGSYLIVGHFTLCHVVGVVVVDVVVVTGVDIDIVGSMVGRLTDGWMDEGPHMDARRRLSQCLI